MPLEFSSRVDKVNVSGRSPEIAPSPPSPSALFTASSMSRSRIASTLRSTAFLSSPNTKPSASIATFAGWSPLMGLGEFIEVLPPQMRVSQQWYQGTADAVYQNIYSIGSERSKFVFVLAGDHIYKMNYARMLQQHMDSAADVTVATIAVPAAEAAKQFGVLETDKD